MKSMFRQASRVGDFLVCPHCGAVDLPRSSAGHVPLPTLEREQNGTYTCTTCSTNFTPPKIDDAEAAE